MPAMAMPMPPVAVMMMMVVDDHAGVLDEILRWRGGQPVHRQGTGDGEAGGEGCADHNSGGRAAQQIP
jgi:hypothetical protein